jgi:AcrR family transcriptional regulator
VSPLPPSQRRAAIVSAVLPLVLERGSAVTSRELAAAAQVAEGTIFKVFGDKEQLIAAVVEHAVDPAAFERAVRELDESLAFDARLVEVTALMQRRMVDLWGLLQRLDRVPSDLTSVRMPDNPAVVEVFEQAPGRIRVPAVEAARRLRAIMLALSNPMLVDPPLSAAEIVDVFLQGVGVHD